MPSANFSLSALPQELQRRGGGLRQSLSQHLTTVTTGRAAAPQRHLQGDLAPLHAIESRTTRIHAEERGVKQQGIRLQVMQESLETVHKAQEGLSDQLKKAVLAWSLPGTDSVAGRNALQALDNTVSALRQPVAGQHLFAGVQSDQAPLPPARDLLAAAANAVAGLTSADDVAAALDDFFLAPNGVFESQIYRGGAALPDGTLPTAADPALRAHLAGVTMAALLSTQTDVTAPDQRKALASKAAARLDSATGPLTAVAAHVGIAQQATAERLIRLESETLALEQSREALIGIDPYLAATQLEETRVALETLYAVTARVSRLNFAEFMR